MDPDDVVLAAQHVEGGRRIILRQHEIIARKRELGLPTKSSESLLTTFEGSQAIFEEHLWALLDEQDHKRTPQVMGRTKQRSHYRGQISPVPNEMNRPENRHNGEEPESVNHH